MRALFLNPEFQEQFERKGYVKLPLLNEEEVKELLGYYQDQAFDNKIDGGFHISLDNKDSGLVTEVGERIKKVLAPKAMGIFDRGKIFTASYVIKEPGLRNIVPPHQDWSFVDEEQFCSVTVWTPLVDVTEENGALGVIPGSHRLFNHPRSSPSPQSKSPLADHIFTLFPYVQLVEMKAGETLIFNNKLIHASPPNLTDQPRIAVGIGVTQEEAQLIHYYHIPGSQPAQLQVYEVDESFYPYYNNARLSDFYEAGKTPTELKAVKVIERKVPDLSVDEMKALVESLPDAAINQPLMDKLARLFNYNVNANGLKEEREAETVVAEETAPVDERTFFQKYTPGNIVREIAWRMRGGN